MKKNTSDKRSQLALKGGSYSLAVTVVFLAILILVNIFVSALPSDFIRYDISANKLYSLTDSTKTLVNGLKNDVTIYWIVQTGQEDTIVENLLTKYGSLSSHIHVVKKNPDVNPTFLDAYTEESLPNNSVIVESGARFRCVSFTDIYLYEFDYTSYSYKITGFDGEAAITSAIDFVVTEDIPTLYLLEGHGEGALPDEFSAAIEHDNIETASLSLKSIAKIPQDADAILLFEPQSDITDREKVMLADYAARGGKLMVIAGPVKETEFTNLNSILSDYGVTVNPGIVMEGDESYYLLDTPSVLIPSMVDHTITWSLKDAKYSVVVPLAQGMVLGETDKGTVSKLLTTSSSAFSKIAAFEAKTDEKEEGDIAGPFTLALTIETSGKGQVIWFSFRGFMEETYNDNSAGANVSLTMNALSAMIGEHEPLSIQSKPMDFDRLTISGKTVNTLKVVMVGALPVAYVGIGICVMLIKRRKENAKV